MMRVRNHIEFNYHFKYSCHIFRW